MVFDVESIGLHGEGFAVGWVVVTSHGVKLSEGVMACDPRACFGTEESHKWVRQFVPVMDYTFRSPRDLRHAFWSEWRRWADQGAKLVADCAWPVETNFMSEAIRDDPVAREWLGPYPLHDLSSIMLARGLNPLANNERRDDELPAHHPLNDARQSARLLVECLS